jgi:hypothetical protein
MRVVKLACVVIASAGLAVFTAAGSAGAAPKPQPTGSVTADCSDGHHYDVVTAGGGNSNWTPAFLGHQVLVPIAFGEFIGSFTGPDGTFPIDQPATVQNAGKGGTNAQLFCTYHIDNTDGTFHFEGDGSVTLAVVGQR